MEKFYAFTLLFICCSIFQSFAQNNNRRISGSVTDSTKTAIPYVKVTIIADKDTLKAETDQNGNFNISKIFSENFSVKISTPGFQDFNARYSFTEKEKHKRLDAFVLKMSGQMLKEVVINAKPNPVRFMKDTVEYNAAAFRVDEGDNVADLLKQLPGMEVDADYNVKTMDKGMTKLRVNGKDFFTNNVKDFIAKLPAGIVSKIQVIDDFGDESNFTGIKIGEPVKMLNIVTKPGMNRGTFGSLSSNAGTNDMIGGNAQVNLWNGSRQSSANANVSTSNNGAGNSRSVGLGLNHNDKLGKNSKGGLGYNFSNNSNAFNNEQVMESLNPEGNFINNNKNEGESGSSNHSMNWNLNYNNKKVFIQAGVSGTYTRSNNQNMSQSNQYGALRQDLNNSSRSTSASPSLNSNISLSKKLKNKKNTFSTRASFSLGGNSNDQNISTNTLYYDKNTGTLLKDSLLKRNLIAETNSQSFNFGFNYSLGLKRPKDTLARQSLNFSYNGSARRSANEVSTFAFDNKSNEVSFIDSLSRSFKSISYNQSLGVNYNYGSDKMRYNLGFTANPNMLSNRDLKLAQTTKNNTFNYSPRLNFSRTLAKGKTLSLNYQGSNQNPTINQLQPLKDTQNLQNILVGNPNLKPSFNHNLNANFNYAHIQSGKSLQVSISASATQKEIMSHVILLPDTLNSLKQISRYENVSGNYQVNGNYTIHIPIKKNKYSLSYSGTIGFSNRAVIFNYQKAFGKGANFSQRIGGTILFKKLTLNTRLNYSVTNNNNSSPMFGFPGLQLGIGQINAPAFFKTTNFGTSLNGGLRLDKLRIDAGFDYNTNHNNAAADQVIRDVSNINMNLSGRLTVRKSWYVNLSASKIANYGYALANSNPLLIHTGLGKSFLKDKSLSININGHDLLAQGNNISRIVSGNTIIDSRNVQQTRFFSLNMNYNLSRFGGRHFRVDAD